MMFGKPKKKISRGELYRAMTGILPDESNEETVKTEISQPPVAEEWVWVDGYKGTDENIVCRDFQFEIGVEYEEEDPKLCERGFHFCINIEDVLSYYKLGEFGRYFKVKALVRKSDFDEYGKKEVTYCSIGGGSMRFPFTTICDKLAAKKIRIVEEITPDEYLRLYEKEGYCPEIITCYEDILEIRTTSYDDFKKNSAKRTLIKYGYSETFAILLSQNIDKYQRNIMLSMAKGLSEEGVSSDMKAYLLCKFITK